MVKKSLKVNAILNGIKTLLSIIFPLITFPYVSRTLQVENLGKVNFSSSIVSYFSLVAALGISVYAIREGSRIRKNSKSFNEFASQVFTLNIISTLLAYLGLFAVILLIPKFQDYKILLFIQSIAIVFTTIGIDWIYSIYEDYIYIMFRSLIFQIISMVLLFVLVRNNEDFYLYALISVISSVGSNLFNFIHSRKYCKIRLTTKLNFKKHIIPILIIFSTNLTTTIYVNSDNTLLGIMVGDYSVGLYSVSVKIYSIIKTLLAAVIIVALPRLSYLIANKQKEQYEIIITKIFNSLSLIIFPTVVGINLLCEQIVRIISGSNYIEASTSLRILSIALIFSTFASFTTSAILLPLKKEKSVLKATIMGAIINILLNLFLIPYFQQNGAAITTTIAEFLVLAIAYYHAKDHVKLYGVAKNLFTSMIGCVAIVLVSVILKYLLTSLIVYTITTVVLSVFVYYLLLILLKNNFAWELIDGVLRK